MSCHSCVLPLVVHSHTTILDFDSRVCYTSRAVNFCSDFHTDCSVYYARKIAYYNGSNFAPIMLGFMLFHNQLCYK